LYFLWPQCILLLKFGNLMKIASNLTWRAEEIT
jgi:hypothetical protein